MPELILLIIIYPLLYISYIIMKYTISDGNNRYFGVRLSEKLIQHERTHEIIENYKKSLRKTLIFCGIISLIILSCNSPAISIMLLYFWIFFTIVFTRLPYATANTALKEFKVLMNLQPEKAQKYITIRNEINNTKTKHNTLLFVLLVIASVIPFIYIFIFYPEFREEYCAIWYFHSTIVINLIILCMANKSSKNKVSIQSNDMNLNIWMNNYRKKAWNRCWIILMLLSVFYSYITSFFYYAIYPNFLNHLIFTILYVAMINVVVVWTIYDVYLTCTKKIVSKKPDLTSDGDSHLVWGMFYNNPSDSKVFKKMANLTFTLNYGHRIGRIINVSGIIMTFVGFSLCLWSIFIEHTPLRLRVEDHQIIATHLYEEHTIDIRDITHIELLEEPPSNYVINQFYSSSKGTIQDKSQGKATFFMVPTNSYFVAITTDDSLYFLSTTRDQRTLEFYDSLLNEIG